VAADGPREMQRIVVGVDGSETSRQALRWAAAEAELHDAELHVVSAWDVPAMGAGAGMGAGWTIADSDELRALAQSLVSSVVEQELGSNPSAKVRPSIERGSTAHVLLEASKGADLLVVGSRGLGGFTGLMLGSVSSKMAHHASCPVVIVRPPASQESA
jgi:nucleotide-binding universal stress UspA family protein